MGYRNRKRDEEKLELSEEVAEQQLDIFLDHYEIFPDEFETEGEKTVYFSYCSKLIIAIRRGKLIIEKETDDLKVTHMLASGQSLTYKEITAAAKVADIQTGMLEEGTREASFNRRIYNVMGSLCGLGYDGMLKLKKDDMKIVEGLGFLLLSV